MSEQQLVIKDSRKPNPNRYILIDGLRFYVYDTKARLRWQWRRVEL